MNKQEFTDLLEQPSGMTPEHTREIKAILGKYPYLQAAHALYLKGLKNQNSPLYNQELKNTAARTQDRSILFDFITSKEFRQKDIGQRIRQREELLHDIEVHDAYDITQQVEEEELHKAHAVLDPDFFTPKERKPLDWPEDPNLEQGRPLEFTDSETHSFTEWLKITSFDPIDRTQDISTQERKEPTDPKRSRKTKLIDRFIASNPKIKVKPNEDTKKIMVDDKNIPTESLMTETLARVYVEQKNYKKAKQAFKILSLKYPEKSGFFADQIRAIEQLQENKS